MLAKFDLNPIASVVDTPNATFMLEAASPGLGRGVNTPLFRGSELADSAFVDKAGDGSFKGCFGSEGPYKGPLSLDRDLRGGIGEGLGGHVAGVREELVVEI